METVHISSEILEGITRTVNAASLIHGEDSNAMQVQQDIQSVISGLPKISLDEMNDVKLMNRTDTKYIVNARNIPEIISLASNNYHVQEIDHHRIADYGTLYLDTKDLLFYRTHMNGKLNRFKWRVRSYFDSQISFLEIKKKTNKGRTQKSRILYNPVDTQNKWIADFILSESDVLAENLHPVLQNNFKRVTLVNNNKSERLTIDFNISYRNCLTGKSHTLNNLGIIEIKYDSCYESMMRKQIAELRIKKSGISKYCLGVALTTDNIKQNSYKRKIRYIHKITNQNEFNGRT